MCQRSPSILLACLARTTLSQQELDSLIGGARVLSEDRRGPKVLALPDGRCLKFFRRKRLISSATIYPYANRFLTAAKRLDRCGIPSVRVESVFKVPTIKRDVVVYRYLEGIPLRQALGDAKNHPGEAKRLLIIHAEFLADLHRKGIYFRSIHFNNVVVCPDGRFGLIDISEAYVGSRPLSPGKRARNFRPMLSYQEDRAALENIGHEVFIDRYLQHAKLSSRSGRLFRKALCAVNAMFHTSRDSPLNHAGPRPAFNA